MINIVLVVWLDRVFLCIVWLMDYRHENQRGSMHVQAQEFWMSHWRRGGLYVSDRSGCVRRRRVLFRKRAVGKKPQTLRAHRPRILE